MRHRKLRRGAWNVLALVVLALVLAACSGAGPRNRQNSLRPKGTYAKEIDDLFVPVAVVAVVVGVLVLGAVLFVAIRYRHREGRPDNPKQVHGNTPLEIGWTLLPAVILAVIAVPTVSTIFSLSEEPANALRVDVVGKQWWWQFEYGRGDSKVVTANELHIPTGRDVFLSLRACDDSLGENPCNVVHSFWVPELAGKRDVVPGRVNTMKLKATRAGTYLGQCAEYCGLSHANMRFRVIAQSRADFQAWLGGQREGPAVPLTVETADGEEPAGEGQRLFSNKYQCANCHTTTDSSASTYGPNLTHVASRTTFASGYYRLTRARLVEWILDAPSLLPMESEDCRKGLGVEGVTCVGMPSFTRDTPKGLPVMTRAEAERIADYLLELR